tara:strand:- start:927 stop:1325 length:399 start_codon:yes stop_codon:yes gene_type:complete
MSSNIFLYKWDETPNFTTKFMITTKYYDFGSAQIPKNIYKISITLGSPNNANDLSETNSMEVLYRTNLEDEWKYYGSFVFDDTVAIFTQSQKLVNVSGLQLRLQGSLLKESYINDIEIEYRIRRKKSVVTAK